MARTDAQLLKRLQTLERDVNRRRTYNPRDEYELSGARLWNALQTRHLPVGGRIRYAWTCTGQFLFTSIGTVALTPMFIGDGHFHVVTDRGGPALILGGSRYLTVAAATWQDPYQDRFILWTWVSTDFLDQDRYIISKWDYGNNRRSYCLRWSFANSVFEFGISQDGTAATESIAISTHPVVASGATVQYYFVGGWFDPGDGQFIAVAAPDDFDLTVDNAPAPFPSQAYYSATLPLNIGSALNAGTAVDKWAGEVGILQLRCPSALSITSYEDDAEEYLHDIFIETNPFYQLA